MAEPANPGDPRKARTGSAVPAKAVIGCLPGQTMTDRTTNTTMTGGVEVRIPAIDPRPVTPRRAAVWLVEVAARFSPVADTERSGSAVAG